MLFTVGGFGKFGRAGSSRQGVIPVGNPPLMPIFAPDMVTLTNQFGGDPVGTAIRNSTATVLDYTGVMQTVPIDVHRVQGARWTGATWAADDGAGNVLFPSSLIDGATWYQSKPDWAAGVAYAAGAEVNYNGRWYSTVVGGTDTALFGDTVVWVDQGIYSAGFGLLYEPAATNEQLHSNEFNLWGAANATADAQGLLTASANYGAVLGTYLPRADRWFTVECKPSVGSGIVILQDGGSSGYWANFDINTGVATGMHLAVTPQDTFVQRLTGGWYRIGIHLPVGAGTGSNYMFIRLQTAGDAVWLRNAQNEQLPVTSLPTSYIPTTTAAVARAAETFSWPVAGNFSQAEGTCVTSLLMRYPSGVTTPVGNRNIVNVDNASTSSLLGTDTSDGIWSYDGTRFAVINGTSWQVGGVLNLAVRWNAALAEFQVGYNKPGQPWVWSAITAYDGAFTLGTLIELFKLNKMPFTMRNMPRIYNKDIGTAAVEAKFS